MVERVGGPRHELPGSFLKNPHLPPIHGLEPRKWKPGGTEEPYPHPGGCLSNRVQTVLRRLGGSRFPPTPRFESVGRSDSRGGIIWIRQEQERSPNYHGVLH